MRPPALALIALACLTASCGGRAGFNDGSDAGVWDGTDSGSGSDSGILPDGGHLDAGASDAGLDGGSTGADAGATDAGQITSCAGVCFAWKPPVIVAPVDPTPVYEFTYDHCDQLGLQPDVCPSNFSCGGLQDRRLVSFTYHLHPCVAPSSGSQHVDLSLPAPPPGGLPVDLTLSLNGGTWPSPSAADAGVGQLYFSNVDGGGGLVMADLPRGAPGTVHVSLPAGTYGVTSAMYSADPLAYPPNADQGTLVVADAGTAPVPYTSVNAHVSFALDGTKIGALGASESLIATFTGQHGSTVRLYYFSGQTPDAHVNFEPDTYTLVVQTASYETGVKHVLSGKLQGTTSFVPSAGMSAQFNLPTVAISG
ncbi:MAG: hypothetical protein JST92_27175, partial [Deltaproteobacteria bacterium]|nr:hypothetical protein [Deltaproteobacteria bacterium]